MQTSLRLLAAALAALPLTACRADDTLAPDGSMFVATVQGSVQDSYRGTGQFHLLPGEGGRPGLFAITSHDPDGGRTFLLFHEGTEAPLPGIYPLASSAAGPVRFGAVYTRGQGDAMEGFTATSGEMQITVSTSTRVKGSFRFRGARNCVGIGSQLSCPPNPLDPAAPSVEVTGSFVAVMGGGLPTLYPF